MLLVGSNFAIANIIKPFAQGGMPIVTIDGGWAEKLHGMDIPAQSLAGMATEEDKDKAFKHGHVILKKASRGVAKDVLSKGPSEFMNTRIVPYLYPRVVDLTLFTLTLDRVKPNIIVLHNDVETLPRLAALWAQAHGVPCLHIPHAIYQDVNRGPIGTDIHDVITASHLVVGGEFQRKWYEDRGFPLERIHETGLPQFDSIMKTRYDKNEAKRLLNLNNYEPVVTYAATWHQRTNLEGTTSEWIDNYMQFVEMASKFKGIQWIVKTHPNGGVENLQWHGKILEEKGVQALITGSHLPIILAASDLVYAPFGSNVLLEAALTQGVRLMTSHGYEEDDCVVKIPRGTDIDGLAKLISNTLLQPPANTSKMVKKYLGVADGNATERIRELIWILGLFQQDSTES